MLSRSGFLTSLLWTAMIVAVSGCSGATEAPSTDWILPVSVATEIREVDPVHVEKRDEASVQLVEDLVLSPESSAGVMLYQPRAVVSSADGRIFVADRGSNDVKIFDRNGDYLSAFGGEGQGPGEFGRLADLALVGDTLVVHDSRNRRLSRWSLAGELIEEHPLGERFFVESMWGFDDGTLVAWTTEFDADKTELMRIGRITLQGERLANYYEVSSPRLGTMGVDPTTGIQQALDSLLATARTQYAVAARGIVYLANLNAYQVVAVDAAGTQLWALKVPWLGVPWTEANKESLVSALATGLPDGSVSAEDLKWPARSRALMRIATDGAGRLYVFPEGTGDGSGGSRWVDVYSPAGALLAAGTVPGLWSSAQGEFVYGLRGNDAGETEVVRYRLLVVPD